MAILQCSSLLRLSHNAMDPNGTYEVVRFALGIPFLLLHVATIVVINEGRKQQESLKKPFFTLYCVQSIMDVQYYFSVSSAYR